MPARRAGSQACYDDALKMLGRRELSERQVRQRLARRGHDEDAITSAVTRLLEERAIDDNRVAEVIARTEIAVRCRGVLRARHKIEASGIAAATARRAVNDVLAGVDRDELLDRALAKRLHGRSRVADEAEFRRAYRFLVQQGFEPDHVLARLRRSHRAHED